MCTATDDNIAATASPRALWRLFEDVAGWTNWDAGIDTGTPRETPPPAGCVDGSRFLVSHELQSLPAGGARVTYAIQVEGPDAETLGALVTADFREVLAALKALAEQAGEGTS